LFFNETWRIQTAENLEIGREFSYFKREVEISLAVRCVAKSQEVYGWF
jgi:hypothetical protein